MKTQLELLHTMDALLAVGRQVVFGCTPHPKGLEGFHHGLKTRLLSAFIVEVRLPDYETRFRIVEARTARLLQRFPREVVDHVARSVTASIRDLLDAVARLDALAREGTRVDLALARAAVRDLVSPQQAPLSAEAIVIATCEALAVDPAALARGERGAAVTWARQVAMYLFRDLLGATHDAIARHFERRPSTVSHALARVEDRLDADAIAARDVGLLRDRLGAGRRPPAPCAEPPCES
jgi:chromosomal replication initiator protein